MANREEPNSVFWINAKGVLGTRVKIKLVWGFKNKVTPPIKTRAVLHSGISDVLQDMWHSCPKVFAIVVSVLPAVGPLPKALIDMACL